MTQVVGISGRLVEGATLSAVAGGFTGALAAQWQAFVNGVWVDLGVPNGTFTVPAGAAGTIYRVVVEGVASGATAPVTLDTRKESAPAATWPSTQPLLIPVENGPALRLFAPLTLTDADKSGFAGGSLQVLNTNSLAAGGDGNDHLGIVFAGTASGQFSYNAATREVSYAFGATSIKVIGQVDAQADGQGKDLKVVFNSNATAAVVDALINNIEYASVDDSPVADRVLTLRVTDATGRAAQYAHHVAIPNDPDAPVILSPAGFEIDENQTYVGTVAARDPDVEPDAPQGITYSLVSGAGDGSNSWFSIDAATGALRFLEPANYESGASYQVRVRAADASGGVTEQAITVSVRNVNEAPWAVEETAIATEDGPPVAITPHVYDPDFGDTWTVTLDTSGTVGRVTWVDGKFMYDTAGAFQSLASYSIVNDSFQYTVTDAGGLSVTRTVTVPVAGSNDAATISGTNTAVLTEDSGVGQWGHLWASGAVAVSDPDQNESRLGLGPVDVNFSVNSDGTWTYNIDNAQLQSLGVGQSREVTYTVRSYDGTATLPVVITLNGVNDAPVIASGAVGDVVESTESDAGRPLAAGQLSASDVDTGDTVAWTAMSANGTYGSFAVAGDGSWTYTLDNSLSVTNALQSWQAVPDLFYVTATDNHGASTQKQVVVTVRGRNDAPVPQAGAGDTGTVLTVPPPDGTLVLDVGHDDVFNGGSVLAFDAQGRMLMHGNVYGSAFLERLNADGSVDETFGTDGIAQVPQTGSYSHASVHPASGAIVLSGYAYTGYTPPGTYVDYALTRLLPDGSLDTSFGQNGLVLVDINGSYDYGANVLFLPDGDMLVAGAGQLQMPDGSDGPQDLVLVRLNADGSLDTAFGNGGKWVFQGTSGFTGSNQVTMDAAGRLLIWGFGTGTSPSGEVLQVFRCFADGTTDLSFGNSGRIDVPLDASPYTRPALALGADGSIALGWANHFFIDGKYTLNLARLTPDGQLDTGFGYDGRFVGEVGSFPSLDLAVDAAGAMLVSGTTTSSRGDTDLMLMRVLADGTVDAGFAGGMAVADLGGYEQTDQLFLRPDGDVLLAGVHTVGPLNQSGAYFTGLARFNADGTLDTSFGIEADATVSGQLAAVDPEGDGWVMWSTEASSTYEVAGTYGSFSLTPWGAWSYTVDNSLPATQALAPGQSATDTFAVRVADNDGVGTTQDVVVTIVGNGPATP